MAIQDILTKIADPNTRASLAEQLADMLPPPDAMQGLPGLPQQPPQNPITAPPQTQPQESILNSGLVQQAARGAYGK